MYNTINDTLKAYLLTNEGHLDPTEQKQIEIAQVYAEYWATNEQTRREVSITLKELNLYQFIPYLVAIDDLNIRPDFTKIKTTLNELKYIDEALAYEETNYLGLSKTAKYHRKRWRKFCRTLKKTFKQIIINHLTYLKEWSKPKTHYISKLTGEVHNGIYWTARACFNMPKLILHGFYKED